MKTAKMIIGILVIIGAIYLGWHFLGNNSGTLTEEQVAVEFALEEQRFAGFESNTELANDASASELLGEGRNLVLNFSAIDEKKLNRLREINDDLEALSNAEEEGDGKDALNAYAVLTKRLEELEKFDTSKLSGKDKKEFDELLGEAQMIVMNRMAVTQPKVEQLQDVIDKIEKIIA